MSDTYSTLEQQASYGIGQQLGGQLSNKPFADFDANAAIAGFTDVLSGQASRVDAATLNKAFAAIKEKIEEHQNDQAKVMAAEGEKFLTENAKRNEITVTQSGLQYEIINSSEDGASPSNTATVKTHYHGTLIDGTVFDSSYERGEAAEFPVNGVIAGWTEALQMMKTGDKWRLYVPHQLAYGERGAGGTIAPFSTLIFDVELLEILS